MSDQAVPPEPARDDVIESLRRFAGEHSIQMFVVRLQLAAELYPEELRAALATVFSAEAAEKRLGQIATIANHAELKLADLVETKSWLEREAGPAIEEALRLAERLAALEVKVGKALDYLRDVVLRLQRGGVLPGKPKGVKK